MPKEQIINDEVDVSKCRFYKEGLCCLSYAFVENGYDCVECSECNNCDYKQLQRKTIECEKLKIEKSNYKQSFELVCKERTRFRDKWLEVIYVLEDLKNENKHLKKCFLTCSNNLKKQKKQYQFGKQALDEIEEYQKRNCETCVFNKTDKCGISCQIFVILNIISKAKDGEK